MNFGLLHKRVTYLMAGLGLLAISLGDALGGIQKLLIVFAFFGSYFVEPKESKLIVRVWTFSMIALLGVQILRGVLGEQALGLIMEFAAALQLSRLFNRRSPAEYRQIGAIALLHLIAASILTSSMVYGLLFLGFVVVTPWMLALSHLRGEIVDRARRIEARQEMGDVSTAQRLSSKELVGARFLVLTALLSVPLFSMTAGVFLVFPRVGLGFLSFGQESGQSSVGFGSNVELGDFGVLRSDATVVLRVTPPAQHATPPQLSLRLRGTSFDHYDGRRWSHAGVNRYVGVGHADNFYAIPVRMPDLLHDRPWQIVLDHLQEPVIFTVPDTAGLQIQGRVSGGIPVGRDIEHAPGVDIRYQDGDGLGLHYTAWASTERANGVTPRSGRRSLEAGHRERRARSIRADHETLTPDDRQSYLQIPEGHERVVALARSWTEGVESDVTKISILVERLSRGEYRYSLELPHVGDRIPLEVFLFEEKRGHCEYYSTALAIMLRSLGIPSRNVTGFLGGRFNAIGGYYAVAQGDAHSWVEAYVPRRGWIMLDATPTGRQAISPDAGWLGPFQDALDALKTRWAEQVMGYDLRSQVDLIRSLANFMSAARGSSGDSPERGLGANEQSEYSFADAWPWGLALLLLAAIVFIGWRLRSRSASGPPQDPDQARAIELYARLEKQLQKEGCGRPQSTTPTEHLKTLAETRYRGLDAATEITERYLQVRYGGRGLNPAQAKALGNRLDEMAKSGRRSEGGR